MRPMARKPVFITALLVLVVLIFAGCLQAQRDTLIRYDADRDLFAVLNIDRGIAAGEPGDLDHLESLWRDRARIYNVPFISGLAIFDAPALRRTAGGKFEWVSLAKATTQPAAWDLPVSLDGLKVIPGKLFVEDDSLCYYDQVMVPGKLVDSLLPQATPAMAPDIIKKLDQELAARNGGGEAASWARLRTEITNPVANESNVELQEVLSTESLNTLKTRLEDGGLRITRQKQFFSVTIPLSAGDVKEAAATVEVWDKKAREIVGKGGSEEDTAKTYLRSVKWAAVADGIKVTVDASLLFSAGEVAGKYKPTAEDLGKTKAAAQAMAERKLPIDHQTHVADVVEQFGKGTLGGGQ